MSNLQKDLSPKVLAPPTKEEKEEADKTHKSILELITRVAGFQENLEHDYVNLGELVYQIQTKSLWRALGYDTWTSYFGFIQDKFGKGKTQLYSYLGTVRTLRGHVSSEELSEIGITKAQEIKKAIQATGKSPSSTLIHKAINDNLTPQEFREAVYQDFGIVDHNQKGQFYDLGGVYFTQDERKEFEKAVEIAKSIDPVIDHSLSKHSQFKEVLFRWIAEFINTYPQGSKEWLN